MVQGTNRQAVTGQTMTAMLTVWALIPIDLQDRLCSRQREVFSRRRG